MKFLPLLVCFVLLFSTAHAERAAVGRAPANTPADRILMPGEYIDLSQNRVISGDYRHTPRRDSVIGETFLAGESYYDYQTNGCVGKMVAFDSDGGIHVTWMDLYNTNINNGNRHQKYNFLEDDEWLEEDGVQVDNGDRGGYGCLWLTEEEEQRAMIFYHNVLQGDLTAMCGIDIERGIGAFVSAALPNYPERLTAWPQGVMTSEGVIHTIMNVSNARMISYTFGSVDRNGEPVFEEDSPFEVSETHLNSYRIARSPHSERVAMTWQYPRTGIPAPEGWDGYLAYQMNNDIYMAVSDDGDDWDFDNPINVTNCIPPQLDYEDDRLYGDTLRPYSTHDIIFDEDDNIHVVFEVRGLWENPLAEEGELLWDGLTVDASFLFHWEEETEEVTPVANGWFNQWIYDEDNPDSVILAPIPGAWKSNVCNPSLAYDENGDLYCVFNYYPYGDYMNPDLDGGRCNGDVAVTVSEDNGETWFYPTMVVETPSLLAEPGEGECETYPTLAERIDDNLHIFYELDLSAGNAVQDEGAEVTLNPFMYQRIPKDEILRDSIWDGSETWEGGLKFHVPLSVDEEHVWTPDGFRLNSVYPNPFNSRTVIQFENRIKQEATITAYSLDGRKVADVFSGIVLTGRHEVTWDAAGMPAGVYIVRLESGNSQTSVRVALVK